MRLKALNAVGLYWTADFQILLENRNWMEKQHVISLVTHGPDLWLL